MESGLRWLAITRALAWSRLTGQVAVMDRYAVCQYVSVRAHGHRPGRLLRAAYRRFPPPDLTFRLVVAPVEAYRRVETRGTDHERLDFLTAAAAAYHELAPVGAVLVDADAPPSQVFQILTGQLAVCLNLGPERSSAVG